MSLAPSTLPVPPAAQGRWWRRLLAATIVLVVFGAGAAVLGVAIGASLKAATIPLVIAIALIPLGIVVPTFLWLDRLEVEPAGLRWLAFGWGALVATAGALILNSAGVEILALGVADPEIHAAVLLAPVTEESLKGLGLLLLLWWRRREINGVIDGIIYAGLIAAGFAFVENILYLGTAYEELGDEGLLGTFIMRGLASPFAHPLFTICIGIGVGLSATRGSAATRVLAPVAGWLCAMALHSLWNLSSVLGATGFLAIYALVEVPLFVAFIAGSVWAGRREAALVGRHLVPYAHHGVITWPEARMIASPRERRAARGWAGSTGGRRGREAMAAFQRLGTELALTRARLESDRPDPRDAMEERRLVAAIGQARAAVLQAPLTRPR